MTQMVAGSSLTNARGLVQGLKGSADTQATKRPAGVAPEENLKGPPCLIFKLDRRVPEKDFYRNLEKEVTLASSANKLEK